MEEKDVKSYNLDSFEAKKLIDENKNSSNFVIIDVRTRPEYNEGYIENAILIDIYTSDFAQRIAELDKSKIYFVYCRTGSRSRYAHEYMKKIGFREVYNLKNGILDWISRGLDVTK